VGPNPGDREQEAGWGGGGEGNEWAAQPDTVPTVVQRSVLDSCSSVQTTEAVILALQPSSTDLHLLKTCLSELSPRAYNETTRWLRHQEDTKYLKQTEVEGLNI